MLCRNSEFQKASDAAFNGTEKERALVAKKFGLVKFKYYAEVQTKKAKFPTFKDGAIKCLENLSSENINESIDLSSGQMVVRFKLTAKSNIQQSLDAQISKAKRILKTKADEFQKLRNTTIGSQNPKANLFPTYLRILDMTAQGMGIEAITEILNPLNKNATEKGWDSAVRETQRNKAKAIACSAELYRYIALRPNK